MTAADPAPAADADEVERLRAILDELSKRRESALYGTVAIYGEHVFQRVTEAKKLLAAALRPAPTEEQIERAAEALKTECRVIFGTCWNNDVAGRFARAVLVATQGGEAQCE